jgi:hypothetical protein
LERKTIELGNWQTDFNQFTIAIPKLKKYNIPLEKKDIYEIGKIMAEARFGTQLAKDMDLKRFGEYTAAHHFDNPLKSNTPLGSRVVPAYIKKNVVRVSKEILSALVKGRNRIGLEIYGRALHMVEDFFAHSNFVEIGLKLQGRRAKTYAGTVGSGTNKSYRLATGIVEELDTVISFLKIIAFHMNKPSPAGSLSTGDKIALIIVKRYSPISSKVYRIYLKFSKYIDRIIPFMKNLKKLIGRIKKVISNVIIRVTSQMKKLTGTGSQPSHSKLNKDDPSRPNFGLAKKLAIVVVKKINKDMVLAWKYREEYRKIPKKGYLALVKHYYHNVKRSIRYYLKHPAKHPARSSWWKSIIK